MTDIPFIKNPVIYYLKDKGTIVYIGISKGQLYNRLASHLKTKTFDEITYEECEKENLSKRESKLILQYKPIYNKNLKHDRIKLKQQHKDYVLKSNSSVLKINFSKIEYERERRGISKIEMARKLKMSDQSYYDFLKSNPPVLNTLTKVAKVLDFDPKDFLA